MTKPRDLSNLGGGFIQSGTGAVQRTVENKLKESISAFDFMTSAQIADVQANTRALDVTVPLQNFLVACRNRKGFMPSGSYKITSALVLDPQYSYLIEGEGWDPNATSSTAIWNYGTGNAIEIHGVGGYDQQITLRSMAIAGQATSLRGISIIQTIVFLEDLWITSHGTHGLYLQDAYGCSIRQCTITQNYQHGVYVYRQGNHILFDHCLMNGNSRLDGYAGCALSGTGSAENLGVAFISCDFTGNGYPGGVTTSYGIVVQHSRAVTLLGCYFEGNKYRNVYADSTVKGLSFSGNYFQDGITQTAAVDGLVYENNFHQYVYSTTRADIAGSTSVRLQSRLQGNTYTGGATSNYTGGLKERVEIYSTAAPVAGTWAHGDLVYHSEPYSGGNEGWVCVTAGTPGTWKSFGSIA